MDETSRAIAAKRAGYVVFSNDGGSNGMWYFDHPDNPRVTGYFLSRDGAWDAAYRNGVETGRIVEEK